MSNVVYTIDKIAQVLGPKAKDLLEYKAKVSKDAQKLPNPDFVNQIWSISDRNPQVLRSLSQMFTQQRRAEKQKSEASVFQGLF